MDTSSCSAAERVYHHVRAAILTRRFGDNELLSEGRIAQETSVSRTPVREALLRLEADGMVRLLPKKGALVLPVTAAEWHDVLATRELVEVHCVQKAIGEGLGVPLADRLAGFLDQLRDAAVARDVPGYVSADRDFHAAIVAAAGNAILTRLYAALRDRQLRMGATNLYAAGGLQDPLRMSRTIADHQALAEAIGRQDAAEAVSLTLAHLAGTAGRLS